MLAECRHVGYFLRNRNPPKSQPFRSSMYAFLFTADERAIQQLTRASQITNELMPKLGVRRICEVVRFNGLNTGWFHFRFDPAADQKFVTHERMNQHLVLAMVRCTVFRLPPTKSCKHGAPAAWTQ